MPRLFVAVDLPEEVRRQLDPLLGAFAGARWARREQLHVTLRFLGSVPPDRVEEVRSQLAGVAAPPAFTLSLQGVGVFPPNPTKRSPPRVLWVGLSPLAPLAGLKQDIDQALGPDPELGDRAFHPHVTLARWQRGTPPPGPELASFLDRHAALASGPFTVRDFHLYESRTLPEGAAYARLHGFNLSPQAPLLNGA
jgi:RNA 2',3'-cyclic 3'-phosphodiesterase